MVNQSHNVAELPLDQIQPNPLQPRGSILPRDIEDLVSSIKEHGVLEPLIIAETPAGYQIIAGERRWRAAKSLGIKTLPVIIKQTTPRGMLEMAIVENVQRTDLNPIERAKAFDRLMNEFNLTNAEIAKRVSKSPSYVSNSLKLLDLPDALKDGLIGGLITEGHARALAGIQNNRLMIEAYKIVLKESASVRRAEEIARRLKKAEGSSKGASSPGRSPHIISEEIDKMQSELQNALGDNSSVKLSRSRTETKVMIRLKGNPAETDEKLHKILAITKY